MTRRQYGVTVVLLLLGGFLGGLFANLVLHSQPAHADRTGDMVKATALVLTDSDGNVCAYLTAPDGTPTLTMYDGRKNARLLLGLNSKGDGGLVFYDAKGNVVKAFGPGIVRMDPQPSP